MFALFKNNCKSLLNIFVLLTGFYTLGYLLTGFSKEESVVFVNITFYLICSVAIFVTCLVTFHYLHDKTSATHILSLPYTKVEICIMKYFSGLVVIVIPSILYMVVISITKSISLDSILTPALLFILIYYTLGCVVANSTGKTAMHIFLYIMISLAPIILYVSLSTLISQYVYGMNGPDISSTIIYTILPIAYLSLESLNIGYIILYLGYGIVLFLGMLWISSKRPFEMTDEPLAFIRIDAIVKFLIILVISWLLMTLFTSINNESLLIVCIFCAVLVTLIAELVFTKKIDILRSTIHIISICVITLVVFFASTNYFQYYIPDNPISANIDFGGYYNGNVEIKEPKAVKTIQSLHKYLMLDTSNSDDTGDNSIRIRYHLSKTNTSSRQYVLNMAQYNKAITFLKEDNGYADLMNEYYGAVNQYLDIKNIERCSSSMIDIEKEEMETFKNYVQLQVQRFKENPKLYQEIDLRLNVSNGGDIENTILFIESTDGYPTKDVSVYKNDPIDISLNMMRQENKAN